MKKKVVLRLRKANAAELEQHPEWVYILESSWEKKDFGCVVAFNNAAKQDEDLIRKAAIGRAMDELAQTSHDLGHDCKLQVVDCIISSYLASVTFKSTPGS